MNKKYIISGILLIVFISIAIYSFLGSSLDYTTFAVAKQKNKAVQVTAEWQRQMPGGYNSETNVLEFYAKDHDGNIEKVRYNSPPPMNFDISHKVVMKGKFADSVFVASEILTKCPSKYENEQDSLIKKNHTNDRKNNN